MRAGAVIAAMLAFAGCDGGADTADSGTSDGSMIDAGRDDAGRDGGGDPEDGGRDDDGGTPNPRLEGLVAEAAATVCGAITRCCDADSQILYFGALRESERFAAFRDRLPPAATLDEASCTAVMTEIFAIQPFGDWVDAAREGRVQFVESELDACIAELDDAACGPALAAALFDGECLGYGPPGGGESQRRMFSRTAGVGTACEAVSDGFGGGFYGSCDPEVAFCCYPRPDGTCGLPSSTVRTGTCAAVAGLGETCRAGALPLLLCATGQYCDAENRCAEEIDTELAEGATCATASFDLLGVCTDGTYCDLLGTRRCEPRKADGASCIGSDECLGGLCDAGTCATDATCRGLMSVTVTPGTTTLAPGATAAFSAAVMGLADATVTWSVLEAGCGTITTAGVYTAPSTERTCTVVATSNADPTVRGTATVTVLFDGPVVVEVTPDMATVEPGATATFTARVTGASDTSVTWSVVETGCGTIAADGTYTAPSTPRTCTVRATSNADPTVSDSATVMITAVEVRIEVTPASATVAPGGMVVFGATVTGGASTAVTWTVDGAGCGTIASDGTYTAPDASFGRVCTVRATSVADPTRSATGRAWIEGVFTLAGTGSAGSANGVGTSASFTSPFGIAWHPAGFFLVTEGANRLRRVALDGTVSSVAITGAAIDDPRGIVVADDGTVFVAGGNHVILAITGITASTGGVAEVLAGTAGTQGDTDGTGSAARFRRPVGLAFDVDGSLLVAEANGHRIRRVQVSGASRGAVTTLAGTGSTGFGTGPALSIGLYHPWGLGVAADGIHFVGQDICVRRLAAGAIDRMAGLCQNFSNTGNADGPAFDARFQSWPRALITEPSGSLLILDSGGHLIRRLSADRSTVSTVAGTRTTSGGTFGGTDGALLASTFAGPTGIALGPDGAYYVVDNGAHRIRRVVIGN